MKKLLVVVDYQNDFIDGALGFENADKIDETILNYLKEFKENNQNIVFTMDTHTSDYLNTEEGKKLPVPHCIKGTKGWELKQSVKSFSTSYPVFEKDGFFSIELIEYIQKGKFDEIYLVGLVTDICVFANACLAKAAIGPYGKIFVVKSGVNTFNPSMGETSLEMLKNLHIECID